LALGLGFLVALALAEFLLRCLGFEFPFFPTRLQVGWPDPLILQEQYTVDRHLLWVPKDYAERLAYNFKADWGAKVYPDKWTGEVRIPLSELGITPAPDALIRMNFVRNAHEGKDTRISAWFSSMRAHADPLSRGWILFE